MTDGCNGTKDEFDYLFLFILISCHKNEPLTDEGDTSVPLFVLTPQAIHRFRVNRGRHILLKDNYVFLPSVSESAS